MAITTIKDLIAKSTTEIEEIVIGTLLEEHTHFDDVKHVLREELFDNESNLRFYQFMKKQNDEGRPWETTQLVNTFPARSGILYNLGGKAVLYGQFIEYVRILQLRIFAEEMHALIVDPNVIQISDLSELFTGFQLIDQEKREKTIKEHFFDAAEHNATAGKIEKELVTIFRLLNSYIGEIMRQQIILIIAATGHSKTLFLWNIILKPLIAGKKVYIYDYEMPEKYLIFRLVAMHTRLPLDWLQDCRHHTGTKDTITENERQQCQVAIAEMAEIMDKNLVIKAGARIEEVEFDAINHRPDIMVIDTIQAFCKKHRKPNGMNNADHITELSSHLNTIVKRHNIAMIQTAQVNRATDGAIPGESNIRESSGIADNAAIILGVRDRSKVSQKEEDQNIFDVRISKNRHKDQGQFTLIMNKSIALMSEYQKVLTIEEESKVEVIF